MAMELTFLGTGAAYPSTSRGASSVVFRHDGDYWMFDCGEGTQIQIGRSGVRSGRISKIFITHLHGDHIFGLPGFLCTLSLGLTTVDRKPVEFFGPKGLRHFLRTTLLVSRARLNFSYIVHELVPAACQLVPEEGECLPADDSRLHPNELLGLTFKQENDLWHLYEDNKLKVTAGILLHTVPCFGYVIEEKPTQGKLDVEKLKAKGIPPGHLYAKIKAGESIKSPDGETIYPEDVLGPSQQGRKVAIMGDTFDSSKMAALCNNVDVLVHEATLSNELVQSAIEKGHSTPGMTATFARSVNAKNLVLTHISQRYGISANNPKNRVELLHEEAAEVFDSQRLIIAEDFMVISIKSQGGIVITPPPASVSATSPSSTASPPETQ